MRTPKHHSRTVGRPVIAVGPHQDTRFLEGVLRFAAEAGYGVNPMAWAMGYLTRGVLGESVGILGVFGTSHTTALAEARKLKLPLVSMGSPPADKTVPAACPDHAAVGRVAVEHLIGRGYRHVLLDIDSPATRDGALAAAAAAGIEAVCGGQDELVDTIHAHRHEWGPVGVVAVPDTIGAMNMQRFLDAGLAVPDDVGVVSAGNMPVLCDHTPVPLTSVDPNHEQVGYEAARLMHKLLTGKRLPAKPVLVAPLGVIERRSTDYVLTVRPEVKAAVAYIREHFGDPALTAEGVADTVGLCRSRLDQVFRRQLRRTVFGEIELRRVRVAKQMLVQKETLIATIAEACGFADTRGLWRAFKRHENCTPGQYRARNALRPES